MNIVSFLKKTITRGNGKVSVFEAHYGMEWCVVHIRRLLIVHHSTRAEWTVGLIVEDGPFHWLHRMDHSAGCTRIVIQEGLFKKR